MSDNKDNPLSGGPAPMGGDIWKELGFDKQKLGEIKAPSKPKPEEPSPNPKPAKK